MGNFLPGILDKKYENILSRERYLARAVASAVIESKPLTVWEVVVPILFFFTFLQFKRSRTTFALNFLFTKKLALEAALERARKGKSPEEARAAIKEKTDKILAADRKGVYSSKIRQRQLQEMELLLEHYFRLLQAEGEDFPSLVRNVYRHRENYEKFLTNLERAEKEVNRAALQFVKNKSGQATVSKMEEAAQKIRKADLEKIFSPIP